MSSWLLGIVGITVTGVVIELLLTDSPMSKFVRSIYAFFILFVIVQPIPAFLTNASVNVGVGFAPDTALIQTINLNSAVALQRNTEDVLARAGYPDAIVTIEYDKKATSFKIEKVYVNAWNITNKNADEIIQIVAAVCNIEKEIVEVFI